MKIGYARVSTQEQNLALQKDALRRAGCEIIYTDQGLSGSGFSRPGLDQALKHLKAGSTLVVWRLDRLGRSLSKLVDLISYLERHKIKFASITEAISTDSSGGMLVFHMMAALAQFERALISERTRAGMAAARARGTKLGRKPALTESQERQALRLLETHSVTSVAERFHVHPRTLRRLCVRHQAAQTQSGRSEKR
ncbi:TPA: recombinase family protein [Burkholderia cenocepacia]|uniref:Recombinase family protein n=1 Tax=Burkholderia latens TaxID=488446 RepID=A0A6H9T9Q8_9BURK|nr:MULTISPECIES: recombinase family protein [Burkholderia]KAB0644538.1 recombinase family protein [Burkholderia latens]MBJ9923946.1 recombinase family protein [Burkholderia cenocepacia]UJH78748.1 recombinase family protein [Burkholderia cenocepacia]HDR9879690.1 recombinase family protein [Burkholderia cenocepacia]HDR9886779.1 recombinase family protein [Burkholderia cenocepacia]